jgi:hypothetical protein
MAAPSETQIKVATAALRAEAGMWDQQAATAGRIAVQAAELALDRLEAGIFQIIVDAYRSVIDQVGARSREGQQRMAGIAQTLRQVAQTYDAEEAENLHRLKNLY